MKKDHNNTATKKQLCMTVKNRILLLLARSSLVGGRWESFTAVCLVLSAVAVAVPVPRLLCSATHVDHYDSTVFTHVVRSREPVRECDSVPDRSPQSALARISFLSGKFSDRSYIFE